MDRRRAVAIATATAATTVGAAAAVAANLGLLGFGQVGASPVGRLDAGSISRTLEPASGPSVSAEPQATIRYEDIYLPVPAAHVEGTAPPGGPGDAPGPAQSTTAVTGPGFDDEAVPGDEPGDDDLQWSDGEFEPDDDGSGGAGSDDGPEPEEAPETEEGHEEDDD